ncbi:MAG TPA: TolC family protein [Rhodocyclaceae bacterium]|nr:TolC family protein [Rhodocyclaceae bacterium]
MPQPISPADQKSIAASDRAAASAGVEPLTGPLTLAEALARGLKYNLDHRTRMMEEALAVGQLDLSRYDMLPKLVASAGYDWRDSDRITRSKDSVTGLPSLANPYISSDRDHTTEDLGLTWNVLDFGVSYVSAKQNADRVLIAAEHRRKAMHLLMQDIRTAYWRAVCADKIDKDLRDSIRLGEAALADSRKIENEKVRDPLEALRYQRTVLENLRILESIQRELAASRIELAALINLPPGTDYQLADPLATDLNPTHIDLPIEHMEELAVANNPDLKEQFYNARIAIAETKKNMLRLFPNLSFDYSYKHDSDSYLINSHWQEASAQISWNLFSLLSLPAVKRYSEANEKLADQRRMTTQMAVLAEVHLSHQQYDSAYILFQRADAIWQVDQRIYEHTANREAAEVKSQLERISDNTSAIVSLLRRFQALSQVYSASSKMQATLGVEPAIGDLQTIKLTDLTRQIDTNLRRGSWGDTGSNTGSNTVASAVTNNSDKVIVTQSVATADKTSASDTQAIAKPAPTQVLSQVPAPAPASVATIQAAPALPPTPEKPIPVPVQPAAPAPEPPVAQTASSDTATATSPHRFYLGKISLPARMPALNWQSVQLNGMSWVADASQADMRVTGHMTLAIPKHGKREAAIDWQITDAQGNDLGQTRYVSTVSKPATPQEWQAFKHGAIAALVSSSTGAR